MALFTLIEPVLLVMGLGVLLFITGLAAGWGLRCRRLAGRDSETAQRQQLSNLLGELHHWTSDVSTDVSEYCTLIEALGAQIIDEAQRSSSPLPTPTRNLLGQMVEANRHLQKRLDNAESTLQQQAGDIASYISLARTDALTNVSNRRVFDESLGASLAAWNTHGKPVSVMLFDIDHFKLLNDTRGHLAGDAVLRELGSLLRENAPRGALASRYGGEEFACVYVGADIKTAAEVAEQLRQVIEGNLFTYERDTLRVTMSCGVAQAMYAEDAMSLLKRCDSALYAAKSVGRNVVCWHDGYHCVPYRMRQARNNDRDEPEAQLIEDFRDVCRELRSRLSQLVVTPDAEEPTDAIPPG